MSWPDPARREEPAEDAALRLELQGMLGLPKGPAPRVEPTEAQIALAEDLRREALRRRHTPNLVPLKRRRPLWTLVAAGLPLVLGLAGIGLYGVQQKRRADELAAAVRQKEAENDRLRRIHQDALDRQRVLEDQTQNLQQASARTPKGPRQLVLPVNKPEQRQLPENLTVSNPRR